MRISRWRAGALALVAEAPESQGPTSAEVAAGMRKIDELPKDIAAAGADKAKATELDSQIGPQWKRIEGTIKPNDQNTYLCGITYGVPTGLTFRIACKCIFVAFEQRSRAI